MITPYDPARTIAIQPPIRMSRRFRTARPQSTAIIPERANDPKTSWKSRAGRPRPPGTRLTSGKATLDLTASNPARPGLSRSAVAPRSKSATGV